MLHTNLHSFHQFQFKFGRTSTIHQLLKKLSIGCFVELYFNLNLHLNLNIKPDFQVNSRLSTFLYESHVNIKEFFSMSCHVTMVLTVIHNLYHDLKCEP